MRAFFQAFKNACQRTYLPSELPKNLRGTHEALAHADNEFFHAVGNGWKDRKSANATRLVLIGKVARVEKKKAIHRMAALATPLIEKGNRLVRLSYQDGYVRLEVQTHEKQDADDFVRGIRD